MDMTQDNFKRYDSSLLISFFLKCLFINLRTLNIFVTFAAV